MFSYDEYRRFVQHARRCGRVVPLRDWGTAPVIILRHDVDLDIALAYRLSLVEQECGICSTYFVLTSSPSYNALERRNRETLRSMSAAGFEIGLHFDPKVYGRAAVDDLRRRVDEEAGILSGVVGRPVVSVSLHNPSVTGEYPVFEGYRNAYDARIFGDNVYLSDSRMEFRGKDPYRFVEQARERTIQVLLHPMHYSQTTGAGYPDILCDHVERYAASLDQGMRANSTYARQMVGDLLTRLCRRHEGT